MKHYKLINNTLEGCGWLMFSDNYINALPEDAPGRFWYSVVYNRERFHITFDRKGVEIYVSPQINTLIKSIKFPPKMVGDDEV